MSICQIDFLRVAASSNHALQRTLRKRRAAERWRYALYCHLRFSFVRGLDGM